MTLDSEHHRAFLSCEGNNLMTVFDLDKHEPIAFLPLADGPDVIKFDPGLGRIMLPAIAAPSPFFIRTIRTTIGRSRTSRCHMLFTPLPWIQRRTVCIPRNKKQMANPSREWWPTTQ